ncbi:MAG: glutathione S-transferase [Hydrogenovibrio sp.]|nr:glutathione S-transferase [Hydrogenovibrio sp.]
MTHPILYSYRRCPYAMRARMGVYASGIQVEQREIVFWDKPEPMLQASPKGTVPVLVTGAEVIDESFDILLWALARSDRFGWLPESSDRYRQAKDWVSLNDYEFKPALDRYKYADRHPEHPQVVYRQQGEEFLAQCEAQLEKTLYLTGKQCSFADIAIFPFIRQFAHVDKTWWARRPYPKVYDWLKGHLDADYFRGVMKNRPVWQPGQHPLWVDEPELETRDQFARKALAQS